MTQILFLINGLTFLLIQLKLIEDGRIQALRKLLQKEGSSICSQLNLFMNEVENSLQNQEITQRHADELKRIVNIVKKENRCS